MTTLVSPTMEATAEHKPCPEQIWGDEMPRTLDVLDLEAPSRELTYTVCDCCQQWTYCYTMLIDREGLPVGQRSFCPDCLGQYAPK